jgi:hypothetical protein
MFNRLIYPIWSPFARPIRIGHSAERIARRNLRSYTFCLPVVSWKNHSDRHHQEVAPLDIVRAEAGKKIIKSNR